LLRHVFYSPRMAVPDNIVKQIAEGRPVVLALLCSGLQTYYPPTAEKRVEIAAESAVTGANTEAWIASSESSLHSLRLPVPQTLADHPHCQNFEDVMLGRTATRRDQMLLSA
jgi:hypothetical protein